MASTKKSPLDLKPIENHKKVLSEMAPEGWQYGGFDEGFYMFQTGSYAKGFKLMEVIEEDLTKENLALMAKMNVTRDRKLTEVC